MRISVNELAEKLGVSFQTVYYWIRCWVIPEWMVRRSWPKLWTINISTWAIELMKNINKPKRINIDDLVALVYNQLETISSYSRVEHNEVYDIFIDKMNDKFWYK